ncbi:hypothetical protein BZA05DRAFT_471119 [Tricharina praecox]|uniref:uncharacterized protein n=1 Tax=Tricharina praecox TaxID=43433 RepID=UPI0022206340|nr:uncharacterized protein BZA05DRAFT_471119 [Tricharina praecox]KAI5856989.1 hypothetical protein BZA05DRAFT_471119 [Tricharina praecox]
MRFTPTLFLLVVPAAVVLAADTGIDFTYNPANRGLAYECSSLPCHSGYPATYGGCAVVNTTGIVWCCPANHTTCWRYGAASSSCTSQTQNQKQCKRDDYSWCCDAQLEYCDTKNGICLPNPEVFANPLVDGAPKSAFTSAFTVGVGALATETGIETATITETGNGAGAATATATGTGTGTGRISGTGTGTAGATGGTATGGTGTGAAVPVETAVVGRSSGGMSKAAVVGVGVGVTMAVMAVGAIGWYFGRQWQRRAMYREDAGEKMLVKPQR